MSQWTNEQQRAIELRDCNLLVSAAAGSGKTAVLVERIIRLITEDLIDIDRLLIVTFTNAAAGEMRERILNAITKEIEKGTDKEEHLRKQISLLGRSYIMTLHSFCIDIVRKNFHLVNIDPGFRIGETTELSIIIDEVLEELLEREYEKGEVEFIKLVEGYGGTRDDNRLRELIYRIYYFIQSKPYPLKWLEESVNRFSITKEEFDNSIWSKTIKESIEIELEGCRSFILKGIKLCNRVDGPQEYLEALEGDLRIINNLIKVLDESLEVFQKYLNNIDYPKLKAIKGERKEQVSLNLQEEVKDLRQKYKDVITNIKNIIFSSSIDEYLVQIRNVHPTMKYLYYLVASFSELFREKKMEKGILDFHDSEHFALEILQEKDIKRDFRDRFDYIFVDEYQDSNLIQETILNQIKRHNNLFLVGDVKQSIYRFRLSDPTLFMDKYNTFSKEEGINRLINLSKNFRTRGEILDGINYIFKDIMTTTLGEIEYNEDVYLYKGLEFKEIDNPNIELNIIESSVEGLDDIDEELEEMTSAELEARLVANKIKSLIGKETYNAKSGKHEEIDFKNIVVLLRSPKNWASIFSEIFALEGIPVYCEDGVGYFNTLEINIFLDLLRVIDNKRQDIPLLSVMRSPIGKFTLQDLIKIRLNCNTGSFYDSINQYILDYDDELKGKLKDFLNKLTMWANNSRLMKLDELIWSLLMETGFYHYVGAMPGGSQRQANLRILVDRASSFEKGTINGLFLFLRFVDKLLNTKGDMGTAKILSENENVVRIMSIHKSKGLEFPIVFCCGLGKQFNLTDAREDILLHKDLGLGPKFVDVEKRVYSKTLPQIAIQRKIKLESLSEELRILYVALTRAIDKLILVGTGKNLDNQCKKWTRGVSPYNLSQGMSYLDWLCCSLIKHHDGGPLRDLLQLPLEDIDLDNLETRWTINILDRRMIVEENESFLTRERKNEFLEELKPNKLHNLEEINRRFNWEYKHRDAVKIPSKLAVSDIKRISAVNIENISYKIPPLVKKPLFIEGVKPYTKAEIGTIIHFVMQHLDLSRVNSQGEIQNQIQEMIAKELLTQEEALQVQTTSIFSFFQSTIGKRILKAPKVYRETPFVLKRKAREVIEGFNECWEDVLIQGIIDCYIEEENDLVLIDYKTGDIYPNNNINEMVNKYRTQMELYKLALEEITKKKVKESIIYLFEINEGISL